MNEKPEALRLAEWAEWFCRNVKAPQDFRWKHMAEAAAELRRLHAENEKLLAVLEEAEYALDYASDMTKPEGLSGCDCPICTASIRIGEVLAGKRAAT